MEILIAITETFLTGLFAGLTLWGLARIGLVPIIGVMIVRKGEEEKDE